MDAGEHHAALRIDVGSVEVIGGTPGEHNIRGGGDVGRFLIGSDDPAEIIQQAEMVCAGDSADLITVLFPNLHPMMSHWDEY